MKFKIGDKVKVIYNSNGSGIVKRAMNKIGIVKSINPEMIYIEFGEVVYSDLSATGFYKNEVEKINTKGQQLLFSFMEQ